MRRGRLCCSALAVAVAGFGSGCSVGYPGDGDATTTTVQVRPRPVPPAHPVQVRVVDGDTGTVVRGVQVRVGARAGRTDPHGVARVTLRRLGDYVVSARRSGYLGTATRISFRGKPRATVRVYRDSGQWTMYGATPQRTQTQTGIHLRPPFKVVWARNLYTLLEFPAVVYHGSAYLTSGNGTLWALSMADGTVLWKYELGHVEQDSSPAVVGDLLVVHAKGGRVYVFDRRTGKVLWSYAVDGLLESSPVVIDGIDYLGTWSGTVYAIDLRHRRVRWTYSAGSKVTSSASIHGNTLYIGDYAGRLLALDRRNGRLLWSGAVGGAIYGTPAVAGGRIFVPSSNGDSLTAFTTEGNEVWSFHPGAYVYSSPAVWAGRVYVGAYNGVFYCLSAATGRVLWEVGIGGAISGSPTVVDGVAYAGSFADRIVGVDARSGRVLFRFPHGQYVPVSGNGSRLLLHGYSELYAVEPRR